MPKWSKPAWLTKPVLGWALFDFANQAYSIVILTAMFQVYFTNYIVPADGTRGEQIWASCGIATQIIIMLISPILGALADFSGLKKELLFVTYVACVALTCALGLVTPGQVVLGSSLFIASYLFYGAGENILCAFLPEVSSPENMGKVSAFAWGVAYTGALVAQIGAAYVVTRFPNDAVLGFRLSSVWAGVFFLCAGLPIFFTIRERKAREPMPPGQNIATIGFHRLGTTFHSIRRFRQLFRYLPIMTFFFAGVQTVYWFSGTMATKHFGFTQAQLMLLIMQASLTGIAGAALTGAFQDRIGSRRTILICLAYWAVVMILAAFAWKEWQFWVVGNLVGLGLGALGTSTRVMVGLFSPAHKSGEFFGFWGMAHKLAAIIGLTATSLLLRAGASNTAIIASNSIFFALGFILMFTINEAEGREAASSATADYEAAMKLKQPDPGVCPDVSTPAIRGE